MTASRWMFCFFLVSLCAVLRGVVPAVRAAAPATLEKKTQPERRVFAIERADAVESLRTFTRQAAVPLVYLVANVRGVTTNAVVGEYTPRDALERLVADTELTVAVHPRSGTLMIQRLGAGSPSARREPRATAHASSTMTPRTIARPAFLQLLSTIFAAAAAGQTPPTAPTTQEPIELSPFTVNVSKDTGYIAADSLVGGRISTNLLTTPADVSVLTRDFLSDVGAKNYREAAMWLTGATVTNPLTAGQTEYGNRLNFRGISGGFPARNYFRYLGAVDDYIVERVEGSRGPNSLLFGDGLVGGLLNTTTKRAALNRPITALQVRVDSEGSREAAFDVNRNLGTQAALRLNVMGGQERTWVDTYFRDKWGAHLAATWRPFRRTEIRLELEHAPVRTGYVPTSFTDQYTDWSGYAVTGPLTANPATTTGVTRFTNDYLVYGPAFVGTGVLNLRNFAQTVGTLLEINGDRQIPNLVPIPRNLSIQPGNVFTESQNELIAAFIEQRFGEDFFVELGFQRSYLDREFLVPRFDTIRIDPNQVLPNGQPNPKFGEFYADVNPALQQQNNIITDYRLAAVYTFPFERFSQRVNVMLGRRSDAFEFPNFNYGRTNGANPTINTPVNRVNTRHYFSDGPLNLVRPPASSNGYTFGWNLSNISASRNSVDYAQAATVGTYWEERVTVIGGMRRDRVETLAYTPADRSADGGVLTLAETDNQRTTVDTGSLGLTFFPIPAVGIYANYSESFNVQGSRIPRLSGELNQSTAGTGRSAGLRFNLLGGGRIVGSIGYYEVEEANRGSSLGIGNINQLWEDVGQPERQPDLPGNQYTDIQDYRGSGWEGEVVANVTRNFRLRANVAFPETQQSNSLPDTRAYVAAHLATWQAAANDPGNANRARIQTNIATLQERITAANDGRQLNNTPKYTANFFATYAFAQGALNGFRVGGGVNAVGRTIIGNVIDRPFDYVYASEYYLATAMLGYRFQVRETPIDLQLNVSNLFDHAEPVYTNTRNVDGRTFRNAFYYAEPRKVLLTAVIRF